MGNKNFGAFRQNWKKGPPKFNPGREYLDKLVGEYLLSGGEIKQLVADTPGYERNNSVYIDGFETLVPQKYTKCV